MTGDLPNRIQGKISSGKQTGLKCAFIIFLFQDQGWRWSVISFYQFRGLRQILVSQPPISLGSSLLFGYPGLHHEKVGAGHWICDRLLLKYHRVGCVNVWPGCQQTLLEGNPLWLWDSFFFFRWPKSVATSHVFLCSVCKRTGGTSWLYIPAVELLAEAKVKISTFHVKEASP